MTKPNEIDRDGDETAGDDSWFDEAVKQGETERLSDSEVEAIFAAARERGRILVAEILSGPHMLTAEEIGRKLGVDEATVLDWKDRFVLLGLPGEAGLLRFPDWQVGKDGKPIPGLPQLASALYGSPWEVLRFLESSIPELGGKSARGLMLKGKVDRLLEVIESRSYGTFT